MRNTREIVSAKPQPKIQDLIWGKDCNGERTIRM
jgi:hypothetical protein